MIKFSFVIVHYQNLEDTCNCIDSIMKQKNNTAVSISIIVVDNASPNNTGKKLKEVYKTANNIRFILLENNVGFSKANNIAYKYAKKEQADLILMLNNDIVIEDNNFVDELYDFYSQNKEFYIISPDIINLNGFHQNPLREEYTSKKDSYKIMYRNFFIYFMTFIPIIKNFITTKEKERIKYWLNKRYEREMSNNIYDFVPFGAFIIYTKKWIDSEDFAFPSDTFLFAEEDHLSYYIKIKKYRIIYYDKLKVKHVDSRSINILGDSYKKIRFKSKNMALARKHYIKFLKRNRRQNNDFSNNSDI